MTRSRSDTWLKTLVASPVPSFVDELGTLSNQFMHGREEAHLPRG
jgi:hypothetical protein